MIKQVAKDALKLKHGAVIMMAARQLPLDDPAVLEGFDIRGDAVLMSFSEKAIQIYVYQRCHPGGYPTTRSDCHNRTRANVRKQHRVRLAFCNCTRCRRI